MRQILIFPSQCSFEGLYPFPVHHPYDTFSMVNLEKPNADDWPMSQHLKGIVCKLNPGDAIFIPACW